MKKLFILLISLSLVVEIARSQEIQADVQINIEQVETEYRYYVATMENDLEEYINNNRFTDFEWEGPPIPVDLSVILAGGKDGKFSARLFVAGKRYIWGQEGGTSITLKFVDDKWAFYYARGASLSYNTNRFDDFVSIIDYYMLILIGFDMDTYGELEGELVYEKAKDIARIGASQNKPGFRNFYKPGEFTKMSLVNELTDLKLQDLRLLFLEFYADGLDLLVENKEKGMNSLYQTIKKIAEFKKDKLFGPSVILQAFFDSKSREIAAMFKDYHDQSVYDLLKFIDPSHTMIYDSKGEY